MKGLFLKCEDNEEYEVVGEAMRGANNALSVPAMRVSDGHFNVFGFDDISTLYRKPETKNKGLRPVEFLMGTPRFATKGYLHEIKFDVTYWCLIETEVGGLREVESKYVRFTDVKLDSDQEKALKSYLEKALKS